jgi:hypothetical protein
MLFLILREDQDVIDEHYDKFIQILHKTLPHQIHEVGRSIFQLK